MASQRYVWCTNEPINTDLLDASRANYLRECFAFFPDLLSLSEPKNSSTYVIENLFLYMRPKNIEKNLVYQSYCKKQNGDIFGDTVYFSETSIQRLHQTSEQK